MGSAVHDYSYSVQVKSRFELFAKDDFNIEDSSVLVKKNRPEKRERRSSGKAKSEPAEKGDTKEIASQKERQGAAQKSEQKGPEPSKRDNAQRGKSGFTQGRMDRHSGSDRTGVKAVIKKDGYGTGNWGTIEDELEAQTAEIDVDQPVEEKAPSEKSGPHEPIEEQPKTLTLKEYREMNEKKAKVTLATKGTRRPNDGKNVFSDMVQVHESKPVETKVEVVLEDSKPVEEYKPNFFRFGRGGIDGRPFPRGGNRGGRGRGAGPKNEGHREPVRQEATPQEIADHEIPPSETPGEEGIQSSAERRGRGAGGERPFRGRGRGRGRGGPFGGFSNDRGGTRGGFSNDRGGPRGGFLNDRGGSRGGFSNDRGSSRGGFSNDRGGFRGGFSNDRGPRGGFSSDRGGPRGGLANDRGGPRGGFSTNRGGRIRGAFGDRTPRGGDRGGGRGARGVARDEFIRERGRGGGLEGGNTRGFRRGARGGLDHSREDDTSRDLQDNFQRPAPQMDSDADFPALK